MAENQTDRSVGDTERVWIVVYNGRWHEDGFEIGGVYSSEEKAEQAAEEQRCAEQEWYNSYVTERTVDADTEGRDRHV